jgi:concentrative nucleoside transporter, CNT family
MFVFGNLAANPADNGVGFIFAFQVLPSIIMISALMSLLYYVGIMQWVVRGIAWVMAKLLRVSGAESLVAASNIFVGQTEAPLFIKPYVRNLTQSEILSVMTAGMATLASGVMASYITMLGGGDSAKTAEFGANLFAAGIMGAFASLLISKILVPESETPETNENFQPKFEKNASNLIEAVASGASDGLKLAANVGGMLLAFIALIALVDEVLLSFGYTIHINDWIKQISGGQFPVLSLKAIFGFILAPFAWLMGVENQDLLQFGRLLGEKVSLNEYVAYVSLNDLQKTMSERSVIMATYALCGFANFSSIAIQIGGIGGLAPERKGEIAKYGLLAVLGGMLATCLSATIVGMWI